MENIIGVTLGWVGTVGTFSAYVLIWGGWVDSTAKRYSLLNAVGGFLAAAGAFAYGAWPAVASNFVWGLIGVIGLITALRTRAATKASKSTSVAPVVPILAPVTWDPTRTEASPIVLPWLVRSPGEAVLGDHSAPATSVVSVAQAA